LAILVEVLEAIMYAEMCPRIEYTIMNDDMNDDKTSPEAAAETPAAPKKKKPWPGAPQLILESLDLTDVIKYFVSAEGTHDYLSAGPPS
jgi:hypothetical protein